MKVKEVINKLLECNQEAEFSVIAHCKSYNFTITYGKSEGVQKHNAEEISIYIDELCTRDKQN